MSSKTEIPCKYYSKDKNGFPICLKKNQSICVTNEGGCFKYIKPCPIWGSFTEKCWEN